jgi:hypothetical protein
LAPLDKLPNNFLIVFKESVISSTDCQKSPDFDSVSVGDISAGSSKFRVDV